MIEFPLFSDEAEMSALGSAILSPHAAQDLCALKSSDFYRPAHQAIHVAIEYLVQIGAPVDLVSVKGAIVAVGKLGVVGGEDYLIQVAEYVPSPANSAYYCSLVKDYAARRALEEIGPKIKASAYDLGTPTAEIVDSAQGMLSDLAPSDVKLRSAPEIARDAMNRVDRVYEGIQEWGIKTGLHDVDAALGPQEGGTCGMICARTSMGKTSICISMALNVARSGHPVLLYELEQSEKQLINRFAQAMNGISMKTLRYAATPENYGLYSDAMNEFYSLPITICDASGTTVQDVRAGARSMTVRGERPLVMVDYLGLIRTVTKTESRNRDLAEKIVGLRSIAKDLQIPMIVFSQLNRSVEQRENKRPTKSDIRDSGEIEEAADWIGMLYRDSYYKPQPETPPAVDVAEFIIDKNREGDPRTVYLAFEPHRTLFTSLSTEAIAAYKQSQT